MDAGQDVELALRAGAVPELRLLRYFLVVATEQSFTGAGLRLGITQQSVSASMVQLEQQLGAALFSREGRPLKLTSDGQQLVEESRQLLACALAAWARIRRGDAGFGSNLQRKG